MIGTLLIITVSIMFFLCVIVIGVILLQEDKSGGGIGIIGGSSQSFLGANSGSVLSKITTILVVSFMLLSLIASLLSSRAGIESFISEEDVMTAESYEYNVKLLKNAPKKINATDFDTNIINKLNSEQDKKIILEYYKKDNNIYILKDKISKEEEKKIVTILNSIGYSLEAKSTIIESSNENNENKEQK